MKRLGSLSLLLALSLFALATNGWSALQIAYCPANTSHTLVVITSDGLHRIQQTFPAVGFGGGNSHINALDYDGSDGFDEIMVDQADSNSSSNGFGDQLWSVHANANAGGTIKSVNDSGWWNDVNTGTNGVQTPRRIVTVANPAGGTFKCIITIGNLQFVRIYSLDGTTYTHGEFQGAYGPNTGVVSTNADSGAGGIVGGDADGDGIDEIFYWRADGLYKLNYTAGANANEVQFGPSLPQGGRASVVTLIGDVDGNGTNDVVVVDLEAYNLLKVFYAPINAATLPVTWTDSGTTISLPYPSGGGDFYGAPAAIGKIKTPGDPTASRAKIVFVGSSFDPNVNTAPICIRDLVTKELVVTSEDVLAHGFASNTSTGVPNPSPDDVFSGPAGIRAGWAALAVGHFVDDTFLATQVPVELSAFQLE